MFLLDRSVPSGTALLLQKVVAECRRADMPRGVCARVRMIFALVRHGLRAKNRHDVVLLQIGKGVQSIRVELQLDLVVHEPERRRSHLRLEHRVRNYRSCGHVTL